jgi:hypothetical protein
MRKRSGISPKLSHRPLNPNAPLSLVFTGGGRNGVRVGGPTGSPNSNGCRTLANLSKLSRRLGLSRFFRTLRIHSHSHSHNHPQHHHPHLGTSEIGQRRRCTSTVLTKPRESKPGFSQNPGLIQISKPKVGNMYHAVECECKLYDSRSQTYS